MNLEKFSTSELLEMAYTTSDHLLFSSLAKLENMFVRRAVARNVNAPTHIVDRLAHDPVQNVSYMALQHRNCTVNREMKELALHDCVICTKDERTMDCSRCNL